MALDNNYNYLSEKALEDKIPALSLCLILSYAVLQEELRGRENDVNNRQKETCQRSRLCLGICDCFAWEENTF